MRTACTGRVSILQRLDVVQVKATQPAKNDALPDPGHWDWQTSNPDNCNGVCF